MEKVKFEQIEIALDSFEKSIKQGQSINFNTKAVDGKIIGTGRADYTQDTTGYKLIHKQKPFILYDVPGIEGNEKKYEEIIRKAVDKAHLIFYVNGSTKKPEPGTAEKLKKYLRNYTDVYSVINLHLPPQNERDVEIDGTYQDELRKEYSKYLKTIKPQTENVLKPILQDNYKDAIILNGLEAFSAYSFDEKSQTSTIYADTEDKGLQKTQKKFFNEYNNDLSFIKKDSCISEITKIIDNQAENFLPYIIETNKKKLIARLDNAFYIINETKQDAEQMCDKFIKGYKEFIDKAEKAKDRFCTYIENDYIINAIIPVMHDYLEKFNKDFIEKKEGKIKKEDYEIFFSQKTKKEIEGSIQSNLKEDYEKKVKEIESDIKKATERFSKDIKNIFKFVDIKFQTKEFDFSKIEKEISETLKDIGKKAFRVLNLAADGALLGAGIGSGAGGIGAIPGAIIGGVIGAVLGFISIVVDIFLSKEKRITKSKMKAKDIFDEITNKLCNEMKLNFDVAMYSDNISEITDDIIQKATYEIRKFENLQKSLKNLSKTVKHKSIKIKEKHYGTL